MRLASLPLGHQDQALCAGQSHRRSIVFSDERQCQASVGAYADEHHDDHGYVHHEEWKKGAHLKKGDWGRGEHIDYHEHHLKAPPRGYEWRAVDGNYVLAAAATGVIASVIVTSEAR